MERYKLYIEGEWVEPVSGKYFATQNPYTGEDWAEVAEGGVVDVDRAVSAARTALDGEWGKLTPTARGKILNRMSELIEGACEHLATIEVRDNGKLYSEMKAQTAYLAEWYRYYGGLADKLEGSVIPSDKPQFFNYTKYEPMGVVAMITPWNSPLLLLAWKLAPALAAGNTAVIKPSEFTSASTLEFMKVIEKSGLPKGVVNVVTGFGSEAGAGLVAHRDVAKIAFTGSDISGQKIYEAAASDIKRVSLELGGKSPNIVFADADIEAAVMGAISGIFAATGQTCLAGSRLLLQRSIHDKFVARLVEIGRSARIGDPMNSDTNIGPVTTAPQFEKVLSYIELAKAEGAICVLGGNRHWCPDVSGGQFVEPTIFTGVTNSMRIAQEEVFGPVLSVIPFDDEDEAVAIANDVDFGLAAGVWTGDIGRAIRVSNRVRAGTVWVNTYRAVSFTTPFGGYKRSGIGRESGIESLKEYCELKSVWIATETSAANPFILR